MGHFRAEAAQILLLLCYFSSPFHGPSLSGMAAAPSPLVLKWRSQPTCNTHDCGYGVNLCCWKHPRFGVTYPCSLFSLSACSVIFH